MNIDHLRIFAGAMGVALGLFYALSGYADSGKTDDLSKNQRVKNLLWLFGGAATVLLTDWRLLTSTTITPEIRASLVAAYAICALTAAGLGIVSIATAVFLIVRARAKRSPAFRDRALELVLEYVQYGYRYFRVQLEKIDARSEPAADAPQALHQIGQLLATLMAMTALERSRTDAQLREQAIDKVLDGIEHTVKLFGANAKGLELRTNFMARVPEAKLDGVEPLFVDGPLNAYGGFLLLRRYRDGRRAAVAVPYELQAREARVLPGAPASVTLKSACCVNGKKVNFAKGVPAKLKSAVKDFFKAAPYASVLSVPLIWKLDVVGVVNVESSHIDVVDQGPDMIGRIAEALGPFCVILGELVHRAEE